ncbi:MAG: hypothetical protein WA542_09380 [Candidatus Acidiferrum sp.]
MISENYNTAGETRFLPRRNYVEVVTRKSKKGRDARPEEKLCGHLAPAIHADGMDKGRLVKVCADPTCKIHFGERQEQESQRLQWKAEKKIANLKAKQTLAFRHLLLTDVLKRVKPQLGTEELRLVAQFVLGSLSHDPACRLAKRHGLEPSKRDRDWELADKARSLYKTASRGALPVLLFEAILLAPTGNTTETEDDPLGTAAKLYKVDVRALRNAILKTEKEKEARQTAAKPKKKNLLGNVKAAHK